MSDDNNGVGLGVYFLLLGALVHSCTASEKASRLEKKLGEVQSTVNTIDSRTSQYQINYEAGKVPAYQSTTQPTTQIVELEKH